MLPTTDDMQRPQTWYDLWRDIMIANLGMGFTFYSLDKLRRRRNKQLELKRKEKTIAEMARENEKLRDVIRAQEDLLVNNIGSGGNEQEEPMQELEEPSVEMVDDDVEIEINASHETSIVEYQSPGKDNWQTQFEGDRHFEGNHFLMEYKNNFTQGPLNMVETTFELDTKPFPENSQVDTEFVYVT